MYPRNQFFKSILNNHAINGQQTQFQNVFLQTEIAQEDVNNEYLWGVNSAGITIDWANILNKPLYFIFNGISKQYVENGDINDNELDYDKLKNGTNYRLLGQLTSTQQQIEMNLTNNENIFGAKSLNITKIYNTGTLGQLLQCDGTNGISLLNQSALSIAYSQLTSIPAYIQTSLGSANQFLQVNSLGTGVEWENLSTIFPNFFCYSGGSQEFIQDLNVQTNTFSLSKLANQTAGNFIVANSSTGVCTSIAPTLANLNTYLQNLSINISKLNANTSSNDRFLVTSASNGTVSIRVFNGTTDFYPYVYNLDYQILMSNQTSGLSQWVYFNLTNCNNILIGQCVDISKIYGTGASNYRFYGQNNSANSSAFTVSTSTIASNLFSDRTIVVAKLEGTGTSVYRFFGQNNSATPSAFQITSSTIANSLISDATISGVKLTNSSVNQIDKIENYSKQFTNNGLSSDYVEFNQDTSDQYVDLNFKAVGTAFGSYDGNCRISFRNESGTWNRYSIELAGNSDVTALELVKFWDNNGGTLESYVRYDGAYIDISSKNVKKDIAKIEIKKKDIQDFLDIDFCKYNRKDKGECDCNNQRCFGIIADDLLGKKLFEHSLEKPKNQENYYVNKNEFLMSCIFTLREIVKDQQAQINKQQQQIDQLFFQMNSLKN